MDQHNVHLCYPVDNAVVGVRAFMHTRYPLESGIFDYFQGYLIFLSQFFHFTQNTIGDVRDALSVKAFHHILYDIQLVSDREIDEIGIHYNVIRRTQLLIVLEEQG